MFRRGGRSEDDFADEVRSHLDHEADRLVAEGLTRDAARREALMRFGDVRVARERFRASAARTWPECATREVRFALRSLRRDPVFALATVVTLALGTGGVTAMFSVIRGVLLKPLAYAESEALALVWSSQPARGLDTSPVSLPDLADWRAQARAFTGMGGFVFAELGFAGDGEPEDVVGAAVTPGFFEAIAVLPLLGRTLTEEEGVWGGRRVVVLGESLWRERFGADEGVLGRAVSVNGEAHVVVGVLPGGLGFPAEAEAWVPLVMRPDSPRAVDRSVRWINVIARLRPGVTVADAQAEMRGIAERLEGEHGENDGVGARVVGLRDQIVGTTTRRALAVLMGAVGFVLLIACGNVANLLLARGTVREREVAVRAALGASRARLARQVLLESTVLSLAAGALGVLVAASCVEALRRFDAGVLPLLDQVAVDPLVLGFALALSIPTTLLAGIAPALLGSRVSLSALIQEGSRGSAGARGRRARDTLVVVETALAVVLLVGAGLLASSFLRLRAVDPGFDPENVLAARIVLSGARYPDDEHRRASGTALVERVRALPGVEAAGITSQLPMGGSLSTTIAGTPAATPDDAPTVREVEVSPDYFRAMRIPLLAGRALGEADIARGRAVLINRTAAGRLFPGENPVGKELWLGGRLSVATVAGVVGDERFGGPGADAEGAVYRPHSKPLGVRGTSSRLYLVVRTGGDPMALAGAIPAAVAAIDPAQAVRSVAPMEQIIADRLGQPRFRTLVLGAFAGLALLMAAVGLYGVLAVLRRGAHARDLALGAHAGDVLGLVVGRGLALAGAGTAIGLAAALALTRLLSGLLFDVTPGDPVTFAGIAVLLLAVATLATWLPARRAAALDPVEALRS